MSFLSRVREEAPPAGRDISKESGFRIFKTRLFISRDRVGPISGFFSAIYSLADSVPRSSSGV